MIESDVTEQLIVERRRADLPTPDGSTAIGLTNDGVFQYSGKRGEWVPFDWSDAFSVTEAGRVRMGEAAPLESVASGTINDVPQVRERAESGAGTKADPFVVPSGILDGYHGLLNFGKGWFEAEGLATDDAFDYAETSVYLQGDGVRTTTLQHAADRPTTPTVHFRGQGGNFGGIRDMTVYGAGEGDRSGSASIVETDGGVIDYQFENVIIRWGGGDALKINTSGSGTRVVNAWLENVDGWAFNLRGGERIKLDNVHTTGTIGGIYTNGTLGEFSNVSLTNLGGAAGIVSTSSGNQFNNVVVSTNGKKGFEIRGGNNSISNVYLKDLNDSGFLLAAPCTVSNVVAENFGDEAWEPMFEIHSGPVYVQNALAKGGSAGKRLFSIREGASRCYLDGIGGEPGVAWDCVIETGATENVIDNLHGVAYGDIDDSGTRTLINRWGRNNGDPNSTGQWHGHAEYAGTMGATIWDTSTDPWTPHAATPDGKWV